MNHDNRGRITVDTTGNWTHYANSLPAGAEAMGTVTRGAGDTGALIRYTESGKYAQLNAGAVRMLDQRKVAAAIEASRVPQG